MNTPHRHHASAIVYNLLVGVLGWGALLFLWRGGPQHLPPETLVLFALLSTGVKRLGFRVARKVTHSLVGTVDLAALFTFGILGGSIVAALSGALCQLICRQRGHKQRWYEVLLSVLFGSGLNVLMTTASGRAYLALGGTLPMLEVTWPLLPAVLVCCVVWFALDHGAWALAELAAWGREGALSFLREILPYSILVELVPLPVSVLIAAAFHSQSGPVLVLTVLALLSVGLGLRQLMVSLSEERRHVAQLTAIGEVSRKVVAILDLDTLFADTVKLIKDTFGYYHVSIFTVDPGQREVAFQASSSALIQQRGLIVPWGQGIIGHVARTGETLLANDVLHDEHFLPDSALEETRAELAVPLTAEQRIVGVLDLQGNQPGSFDKNDVFVLQTLADQVAIAIQDSRLYEAQEEQAWVSTALLQVANAVAQLSTSEEILETVVRLTPMLSGVDRCLVFLWSAERRSFLAVQGAGLSRKQRQALQGLSLSPEAVPLLERVHREGQIAYGKSEELLAFLPPPLAEDPHRGELTAVPLRTKGEVIGIMVAEELGGGSPPVAHRQAILTGIAHHAAMALENARLYAAQREEAWVSTALLQVANTINATANLDDILSTVVRMTPLLVGVSWCGIMMWDEGRQAFFVAHTHGLARAGKDLFEGQYVTPDGVPLLTRAMSSNQPISVLHLDASGLVPPPWVQALGSDSLAVLPLRVRDRLLGLFLAGCAENAPGLTGRGMNILLGIASQTALAIEADQLYQQTVRQELVQREIELAHGIQESFLPECCPQIPGWQIATAWHAARGVGGDSYDFIRPDSGHLGLVITDVSGKGVGAALYMALSRTAIRTAALGISSPAETLRRANRILMEDSRSGMFVSVFYGLLDLESGHLAYARAGHNPPLLVRAADRSVSPLAASGVVLGILDNPEIAEESVQLAPGDTLVAYTDGVTEAVDEENQEFGEERLQQILAQATDHSASSLIDLIEAAVRVFTGEREQFDDMTLVVAKREES